MYLTSLVAAYGMRRVNRRWLLVLAFLPLMLCPPCMAAGRNPAITPVIDVSTLKTLLARPAPAPVLVDVRDNNTYDLEHLPGAVNVPVEHTFNETGDRSRIASLQQIRKLLSIAGIKNSDYLVLYDDGSLKDAAHVFWVLETYGHKKLSVLDGGVAAWTAQHGKLTGIETLRQKSQYIPNIATHRLSTKLATLLGIKNSKVEIIDARVYAEYVGLKSASRRKGHIPGAISIPWKENLARDKPYPQLKSTRKLHALYHALDKKEHIITYCNRGKESAVSYLVLRDLGYNVSIYDGAWLEWGNDDQLPIATGAKPYGVKTHAH